MQSLHTQGYMYTCALCTHTAHTHHTTLPLSRFLSTRSHTHSVTLQDQNVRRGDRERAEAATFNPSRDPGEMSGTDHLTASQGTLWAGQPGLSGSERFSGPGDGAAGRGAGACLGLYTHSPTLGVPGSLRPLPWEPSCRLGRRVRATGPPPLSGFEAQGQLPSSCHQCPHRENGWGGVTRFLAPVPANTDCSNIQTLATFCKGLAFPLQPPRNSARMQLSNACSQLIVLLPASAEGPQPLLCPNSPVPFCAQGV